MIITYHNSGLLDLRAKLKRQPVSEHRQNPLSLVDCSICSNHLDTEL